jgi:CO/xanthine dehydrogenase FAD-binding subunit
VIHAPRTLDEALALRAAHPEAVVVAGGTDVMVAVNFGRLQPESVLDLGKVEELKSWWRDDEAVFVGAGTTFARIERELAEFTALAQAARSVGSPQIRNRGTIGGNLGTASPAGDALPVLAAYDAKVVLGSVGVTRKLPWDAFLLGPKRTALEPDELILGVEWAPADGPGAFLKVGPRNAMTIAVASVCLQRRNGSVRLALGSVAPTVIRAPQAEARADDPVAFGRLAAEAASPIDDVRGSAAYRRHAVEVLARRALAGARC